MHAGEVVQGVRGRDKLVTSSNTFFFLFPSSPSHGFQRLGLASIKLLISDQTSFISRPGGFMSWQLRDGFSLSASPNNARLK